jgi:hypothetical protein
MPEIKSIVPGEAGWGNHGMDSGLPQTRVNGKKLGFPDENVEIAHIAKGLGIDPESERSPLHGDEVPPDAGKKRTHVGPLRFSPVVTRGIEIARLLPLFFHLVIDNRKGVAEIEILENIRCYPLGIAKLEKALEVEIV